jgi:hypothetical protein
MNPSEDVYRVAYDSANSELNEILRAFEDLRSRKERVEKVVLALKPLMGADDQASAAVQGNVDPAADAHRPAEEVPSYQYQAPNGAQSDPFQRRIDQVLGQGVGSKEVRRFNRQF